MARRYYTNADAGTTITSGINSSVTSVNVTSAGTLPPSLPFTAVIDYGLASAEVVLVTAVAGTALTIQRGYDGTSALSHSAGATLQSAAVSLDLTEANLHVNSNQNVHGVTGNVVGDSDTQTLSNKTLSKPLFTGDATTPAFISQGSAGTGKVASMRNSGGTEVFGVDVSGNITAGPAPVSFSPQWAGVTVGNGVSVGNYVLFGKLLFLYAYLSIGSTTTATSNITLPLPNGFTMINSEQGVFLKIYAPGSPIGATNGFAYATNTTTLQLYSPQASNNITMSAVQPQSASPVLTASSNIWLQGFLLLA